MITLDELTRRFGRTEAVRGLSFEVPPGEIFGFLGPNGSGKTTTIKMLCTLLRPTSGTARINGADLLREPERVRASLGLLFQDPSLDPKLTALENLYFYAWLYEPKASAAELRRRIDDVLELVELSDDRARMVSAYSWGMKRRLEIARALIGRPAVLLLDEPTTGLDVQSRQRISDYLRLLRDQRGVSVFLATHDMVEAETCDRVVIIDRGERIALGTPADLKRAHARGVIEAHTPHAARLAAELASDGLEAEAMDGRLVVRHREPARVLGRILEAADGSVSAIRVEEASLCEVFLNLTGRELRPQGGEAKDLVRHRESGGRRD